MGFNFYGNTKGQFCHADGAARMGANVWAKDAQNHVGATVDNPGDFVKSWRSVNHTENPQPLFDSVQVADIGLDAGT